MNDDINFLLNLAANRRLSLSICQKENKYHLLVMVYDLVGVKNHGDEWDHKAYLMLVDFEDRFSSVKWETTRKIDNISIFDLYELEDIRTKTRKFKQTDFLYLDNSKNNNVRSMEGRN